MSLIAWYKLDKLNGSGLVPDSSGNGLDGTLYRGVSFGLYDGRQAASFNGSTGYIDCNSRFAPAGDATFSCWIKPTVLSSSQRFISQLGSSAGDMLIRLLDASGIIRFVRWNGVGGTIQYWTTTVAVVVNQWNFVCVTYSAAGAVTIRINETTETPSMSSVVSAHAQENFQIGGDSDGKYAGLICDVRVHNDKLSAEKIQAIYRDRKGRPYPWQPHIVEPTVEETVRYG
jgi:hypothetical protein